ncbi:phage tail protein [Alcaligenes faecalis]|uniref:hypothetical protein n=1 Tax=Alcaligenes faecalis TaxID=511 RepID=UPI0005AB7545|nr:hypothetical protein [Alcaligenes faecalis]ATH99541.1 hypothetical protein CPY64_07270 [Alcaligenes faecalis]AYZ92328.1 hypothetical protein EGY22_13040 [Alcaligenes faecalis]MCX5593064.1 hypothetical protein [Alcaligenes faecalis]QQC31872.1 hypothetical protein I6H81_14640 [Alcaligenes faecalis]CAJ0903291.1 Phage major tail protein, TP901-1 family [Alcaligenes faecalis subsp. faecalis]
MSSKVILVQGSSLQISKEEATSTSPTGLTFDSLDCVGRQIQWQGGQATENDVTTLCSTAKEFRLGLTDAGTMTVTGHWVSSDDAQKTIKAADRDKKPRLIELTFSDGSKFASLALVQQRSFDGSVDGVWSGTFSFRLTGEPLESEPPASS